MANPVVNVAFISDDNYVAHLAVTIISMLENIGRDHRSSERPSVDIYILDAGIAPRSRDLLLRSISGNASQCRLSWSITFSRVSVPESLNVSGGALRYLNRSIFAKLYLPELLPPQVQKIIFLDSDLLVLRDVLDLWFTDVRGAVLAATRDSLPSNVIRSMYPADVTWKPDWKVANTGVMILDIGQLRLKEAHKELIEIATRYSLPFLEQDAWNLYCRGDWFELDERWNVNMMAHVDASMNGQLRSREVLENAFVVHFCGKPKPWDCKLRLPWAEQYYERLASTAWDGSFPKNESPERIEAEKYLFTFKTLCRLTEPGTRGMKERQLLPTLHRALVDFAGTNAPDLARLRSVLPSPEFTTAIEMIEQRATVSRTVYEQFDPKVYLNEICHEISTHED